MDNDLEGFVPYTKGLKPPKGSGVRAPKNELTGKSGAYVVNVKASGKLYVGSSSNLVRRVTVSLCDLKHNRHNNKNLQEAYNKNPNVDVWVQPTETTEQARQLEQETVDKLLPTDNLTNRGVTDVTRANLGLPMTEESKKRISDANRGHNRKPSEETRLRMSEANLGKVLSDEHKQRLSIIKKEFYSTDDGKASFARGLEKRKELVIIGGITYPSVVDAAKALGIPCTTIASRCKSDNFPGYFKIDKNT